MPTFGLTLALRDDPGSIARYREEHRDVWPGVMTQLRAVGVERMEIFLSGRRLFMHLVVREGFDPVVDFARLSQDPISVEWDALMRTLQEPVPEARPGEWWSVMERVFDLGGPEMLDRPIQPGPG
jgi:L-rhamnose mutarotase